MQKPKLVSLVQAAPERTPEGVAMANLARLVPQLIGAEGMVRGLRAQIAEEGRKLARIRGVAFIRDEHLRREFGQ